MFDLIIALIICTVCLLILSFGVLSLTLIIVEWDTMRNRRLSLFICAFSLIVGTLGVIECLEYL